MSTEHNDLDRTYSYPFCSWDIRLYLDSHPDDRQALRLYQTYQEHTDPCNYAAIPECFCGGGQGGLYSLIHWPWVDAPWPWEREANEQRGCV